MIRALQKMIAPLRRRVLLMVSRGVVTLVNDSLKLQGLQVTLLAGETADRVERFQQFGFTAHPEPGAEVIALAVGGNRSHLVVIACDDRRYRPKNLAEGESAQYDKTGSIIHLRADGSVEITPSGGTLKVNGDVAVTGGIEATGDIEDAGGTIQAMRDVYNTHTQNVSGSTAAAPISQM